VSYATKQQTLMDTIQNKRICHFLYVPFLGLGLYGGYRGARHKKNRIKIFKQFVIPSLLNQTNRDFTVWVSWRYEDKNDQDILALKGYIDKMGLKSVFTFSGVCFWDDKYPDDIAKKRLIDTIRGSMGELLNTMGECEEVLMTIQPSDDCYFSSMVQETQSFFKKNKNIHAYGYFRGYVMDYINQRLAEWNPKTTPPFYTIRFKREIFIDPLKHVQFIGPYKSHEYVKDFLPAYYSDYRGFIVGTHGENISTIFNHPFTGQEFWGDGIRKILFNFGLLNILPLKIKISMRKKIMRLLPYGWQRKLRYWLGKIWYIKLYEFLRN